MIAEAPSITVEQLLVIVGSVLIPTCGGLVWLLAMLYRLEGEIRMLKEVKQVEQSQLLLRVEKVERSIHEIRNVLQALTLAMVKGGISVRGEDDKPSLGA